MGIVGPKKAVNYLRLKRIIAILQITKQRKTMGLKYLIDISLQSLTILS